MMLLFNTLFIGVLCIGYAECGRLPRTVATQANPQLAVLFDDTGAYKTTCVVITDCKIACHKPSIASGVTIHNAKVTPGGPMTISGPGTLDVLRITDIECGDIVILRVCPCISNASPVTLPSAFPYTANDPVVSYLYDGGVLETYDSNVKLNSECPSPYNGPAFASSVWCALKSIPSEMIDVGAPAFIGSIQFWAGFYKVGLGTSTVNSVYTNAYSCLNAIKY